MEKSLREVCEMLNVSRRAVQGYENAGLVSASGRNDRGYLLYDEKAQERIEKIRMYQDIGFSIKEIVHIIDAPSNVLKAALIQNLDQLQKRKEELDEIIKSAYKLIEQL